VPINNCGNDFRGGIFCDEAARVLQNDRLMVGEQSFPAEAFAVTERDVAGWPQDERGASAKYR
jgi:hypothetical protein